MKKVKDILKVIFLLLAILTMAVSLFGRASADSMPSVGQGVLNDFFSSFSNYSSFQSYLNQIYNDCPYFVMYNIDSNITGSIIFTSDEKVMPFSSTSYTHNDFTESIGTTYYYRCSGFSMTQNYPAIGTVFYQIAYFNAEVRLIQKCVLTTNCIYSFVDYPPTFYGAQGNITNLFGSAIGTLMSSGYIKYVLGDLPNFNSYDLKYLGQYSPNLFPVVVNSDISVYKSLDNNGLPVLNVSWSKTPLPTTGGINYAGYTNVDIKFNIDGSERVVSINSDDYPELFSNYADGKFYIPWSVFQKVALLVTDYDQVNEVSVVQVDVSMKGYPQSASIESAQVYSMNTLVDPALVFKGQDNSIPVFDNDQIVKQPDEDVSINVTEYNDYIQSFNSYRNSDGLWHLVSSYDNDTNSDILHINAYVDDPDSPDGYVIDHFSLDSSGGTSIYGAYFSDYFYENAYTLDYDMIVFHVFVDRRPAAVDFVPTFNGYIVYYTNRYYLRLLNTQAVNISDLFRVSNNYAYMTYDFLFDRLNNINDNLISYFVSDSNKQNTAISYLGSINVGLNNLNSNFVNLTASTHNYLDRILSAVNGIDFEGTDLTGVLSKMDSISSSVSSLPNAIRSDLVYLFKPSYDDIDVSFQQYKDSIGILSLPFDTSKMVLETVDQNYNGKLSIDVPKIKFMSYELFGGQHYELDPWQFFNDQELSEGDDPTGQGFVKGLRYFIAFSAILGAVLGTYLHIFRRKES